MWFAVGAVIIVVPAWLLFRGLDCRSALFDTDFAGWSHRLSNRYLDRPECGIDAVGTVISRDYYLTLAYAVVTALLLTVWWNASWDTEPGFSNLPGSAFAGVALAVVVIEFVGNTLSLVGLREVPISELLEAELTTEAAVEAAGRSATTGETVLGLRWAQVIFTLAWAKWTLVALLAVAVVSMLLAWLIRTAALIYRWFRRSDEVNHRPPVVRWEPPAEQPALGICLSGGGIRAAAFGLGGLSALEESEVDRPRPGRPPGILGQADLLASVSGGGYAASAWRQAVGTGPDAIIDRPVIGDPNCYGPGRTPVVGRHVDKGTPEGQDLFPSTARSPRLSAQRARGLVVTGLVVLLQMAWHLTLTLAVIVLTAWPIGRLIASWAITTPSAEGINTVGGVGTVEYRRLVVPVVWTLVALAGVLVVRSFTNRGRWRRVFDLAALALIGLAGLLATALLVLPWMVLELLPDFERLLPGEDGTRPTLVAFLAGGVVFSVVQMFRAPIQSRARYLGGVLLGLGLAWLGLLVASQSALGTGVFRLGWDEWLVALCVYVALVILANPDLWSLHWLYRRRLGQTFANRWSPDGWTPMGPSDLPSLSSFAGAPGPQQVICSVAARGERTNTGIPVVSMTFEPDWVAVHCGPDPDHPTSTHSHAVKTAEYEQLFHGRLFANRYRSVMCAAALSAAAFAPSLGRHHLGTTNALIAALNVRLGMWMPNPMYTRGRRAGPDLFSMFKELTGSFDLADPNVYVTDGGHWENLALVELIRRRARRIISIDASGDQDYSFNALQEAIELGELECATVIEFEGDGLDGMRPGHHGRPARNHCIATITYPDGAQGRLLYVKAQSSRELPLDILRYAKEDPTFPNYSTADQFLSEPEFCNLAILGRESMIRALRAHRTFLFAPMAGEESAAAPAREVEAPVKPAPAEPVSDGTAPTESASGGKDRVDIDLRVEQSYDLTVTELPELRKSPE